MIIPLYRTASILGEPVIRLLLSRRRQRGKEDEDAVRFAERFGHPSRSRPDGKLAWIHAASVGEAISVLCLIDRLRTERPTLTLLITTGTVTSARLMAERLPAGVIHQYAPVDHPRWIGRFLDHWRPDLALWVESEFWPNTLSAIGSRKIPLVLLNARISPGSFKGWRRIPGVIARLLNNFSLCLAQSIGDGEKLTALGARDVRVPGNLKFAASPLPAERSELNTLTQAVGGRPVWAAVSTHPGEDEIVIEVHGLLKQTFPDLLTIIVPRHPVRGKDIATKAAASGNAKISRRAAGDSIAPDTDVYIVDTVGDLGLIYRLASVAFIGGSLVPHGGQNLLEAAKLDCAIVHGPWMTNFAAIVDEMRRASAVEEISDGAGLAAAVANLLQESALRQKKVEAAAEVAGRKDRILDDVLLELAPFLDAAAPRVTTEAASIKCHARS